MNWKAVIACLLLQAGLSVNDLLAQASPLEALDDFYQSMDESPQRITEVAHGNAHFTVIQYDSAGRPVAVEHDPTSFQSAAVELHEQFEVSHTPMVLIFREHDRVASVFLSVFIRLKDRSNQEQFELLSAHSIKLVWNNDRWQVISLNVENEHPMLPLDSTMAPEELIAILQDSQNAPTPASTEAEDEIVENYNPQKVYRWDEVDEPPVYPGDPDQFRALMDSYQVALEEQPGYTPFMVQIDEEGMAKLSYAHDLSGYQISTAGSFVRSMLSWYPAIKDVASVKCNLLFYIRD